MSALSIKLTSSIDDVLWLGPFLTTNVSWPVRLQNAFVYTAICMLQTLIAMVIAYSGDQGVEWLTRNQKNAWSSEKILTVAAGSLISMYTCKLSYEWYTEWKEETGSEESSSVSSDVCHEDLELCDRTPDGQSRMGRGDKNSVAGKYAGGNEQSSAEYPRLLACEAWQSDGAYHISQVLMEGEKSDLNEIVGDFTMDATREDDKLRQQTLFVMAFIGSLDDLTLFVPMLVGKGFNPVELMSGAFLAASTIVTICLFLGFFKPIADFMARIPLALIVAVFAVSLLSKACTME